MTEEEFDYYVKYQGGGDYTVNDADDSYLSVNIVGPAMAQEAIDFLEDNGIENMIFVFAFHRFRGTNLNGHSNKGYLNSLNRFGRRNDLAFCSSSRGGTPDYTGSSGVIPNEANDYIVSINNLKTAGSLNNISSAHYGYQGSQAKKRYCRGRQVENYTNTFKFYYTMFGYFSTTDSLGSGMLGVSCPKVSVYSTLVSHH